MTDRQRLTPQVVLSATLAGFVLAHAFDYAVVFAEPHEALEHTGHGYLGPLSSLAWALLACGAVAAGRHRGRSLRARAAVALLAAVQSAFFVTVEVTERLVAHEPLTDLVHTPLLAVGLASQVVVAGLLVALLFVAAGTGYRLPDAVPELPPSWRPRTPYLAPPVARGVIGLVCARGPPAGWSPIAIRSL